MSTTLLSLDISAHAGISYMLTLDRIEELAYTIARDNFCIPER
jgi:hypothetical protein